MRFRDHAGFGEAHFFSAVRFDSARFEHLAWFQNARFKLHVSFDRARFVGMVNFKSIILPEEPDVRDRVANLRSVSPIGVLSTSLDCVAACRGYPLGQSLRIGRDDELLAREGFSDQGRAVTGDQNVRAVEVFVSSPGDVMPERKRIDLVAQRLNEVFEGRVRIKTVLWERKL